MIRPIYQIKAFDPLAAVTLVVVTSIIGYFFGYVSAVVWNKLHRP